MHIYQILLLISGACLNTALLSLTFYASKRIRILTNHVLKSLSMPLMLCLISYVWHENTILLIVCICALSLSPFLWPYNHYGSIFQLKSNSVKKLIILKIVSLTAGLLLSWLTNSSFHLGLAYSFGIPIFHLILLSETLLATRNTEKSIISNFKIATYSLKFEILFFVFLFITMFLDYQSWIGISILILTCALLILLGTSIVFGLREYNRLQSLKKAESIQIKEQNITRIQTNLALENKLSSLSGKANMIQLNYGFINKAFASAHAQLENSPKMSATLLTKLAKHLRNMVQFDFPATQPLKQEIKILEDLVSTANMLSNNKVILDLNQNNTSSREIPSRLLVTFVNILYTDLSHSFSEFCLNISAETNQNKLVVKAIPNLSEDSINIRRHINFSKLNHFLFLNQKRIGELAFFENTVSLHIYFQD